jgi:uncharacterized protein with GYD domain
MVKYLSIFTYSPDGSKGMLKEKATAREAAARKAFESAGGKLETFYWAGSGEVTGVTICDFPDAATGTVMGLMLNSSGAFSKFNSIELISSSDVDRVLEKPISYRPPGR